MVSLTCRILQKEKKSQIHRHREWKSGCQGLGDPGYREVGKRAQTSVYKMTCGSNV